MAMSKSETDRVVQVIEVPQSQIAAVAEFLRNREGSTDFPKTMGDALTGSNCHFTHHGDVNCTDTDQT